LAARRRNLNESQTKYLEFIWREHNATLSNPKDEFFPAAKSFQGHFEKITKELELQKRLYAALMDAYHRDRDFEGLPKYSKEIWLKCGTDWGVEAEIREYVDKYWSEYTKDSELHLRGHADQKPRCVLCGKGTMNDGTDVSFRNHYSCMFDFYGEMENLKILLIRPGAPPSGIQWKPTKVFQRRIDRCVEKTVKSLRHNSGVSKDLATLAGIIQAVDDVAGKKIEIPKALFLTAITFEAIMRNRYGATLPPTKDFNTAMSGLQHVIGSNAVENTRFASALIARYASFNQMQD